MINFPGNHTDDQAYVSSEKKAGSLWREKVRKGFLGEGGTQMDHQDSQAL